MKPRCRKSRFSAIVECERDMRWIAREMPERRKIRNRLEKLRAKNGSLTPAEDIERRRLRAKEKELSAEILERWEKTRVRMNRAHAQRERILRMYGVEGQQSDNSAHS